MLKFKAKLTISDIPWLPWLPYFYIDASSNFTENKCKENKYTAP